MLHKSLRWLVLTIASIIVLSMGAAAAPVSAAGISVSPTSGGDGTTFTVTANGFQSNGIVDTWVTRADMKTVGLGTIRADSSGQVQFSITPPTGWPKGEYIAVAHARTGGLELFVKFGFNAAPPPKGQSSNAAASVSGTGISVSPRSGGDGTTFTVTANDFQSGGTVDIWVTRADMKTIGLGSAQPNSAGQIKFSITPPSDWPSGEYIAVVHARTGGLERFVKFGFNAPPPPIGQSSGGTYPDWKGEYFDNQTLSGLPVLVRNDTAINFNWGLGSPDPAVPSNHFSVRWTRDQYFNAGTYAFTVTTDDGMRLWVGDTLLIDSWYNQSATHTGVITLAAGTYPLRVEYYENTGAAVAQVSWTTTTLSSQAWTGYYYNNRSLSGNPVLIRQDAQLNFNWGGASPGSGVPGTNWSAKWDSSQYASYSGNYTIYVTADDGVRVWLDGSLVIDQWHDQPPTQYAATRYLNAGYHTLHVEYYQHTGGSVLQLQFVGN
jgi:PA14 domain